MEDFRGVVVMKRTGETSPAEVGMSKHRGQGVMGERLVLRKSQLSQHGTEVIQLPTDSGSTTPTISCQGILSVSGGTSKR